MVYRHFGHSTSSPVPESPPPVNLSKFHHFFHSFSTFQSPARVFSYTDFDNFDHAHLKRLSLAADRKTGSWRYPRCIREVRDIYNFAPRGSLPYVNDNMTGTTRVLTTDQLHANSSAPSLILCYQKQCGLAIPALTALI